MSGSQPSGDSAQRMDELNADTGSTSSADELKERLAERAADTEHGTAEGAPDPLTGENSPEDAGTQKEGMEEVDTQDQVVPPMESRGGSAPQS